MLTPRSRPGRGRRPSPADLVAAAAAEGLETYARAFTGGRTERRAGVLLAMSGAPAANLNAVISSEANPDPAGVSMALAELAARGLPHSLQGRPGAHLQLRRLARRFRLRRAGELQLLALPRAERLGGLAAHSELTLRRLAPDEGALHGRIVAAAFGAEPGLIQRLYPDELLGHERIRVLVGETGGGAAVTTAMAIVLEGKVGVYDVATLPSHRRRGYGGAITAACIREGAGWAFLQSTWESLSLYRRLGFAEIERWPYFASA